MKASVVVGTSLAGIDFALQQGGRAARLVVHILMGVALSLWNSTDDSVHSKRIRPNFAAVNKTNFLIVRGGVGEPSAHLDESSRCLTSNLWQIVA